MFKFSSLLLLTLVFNVQLCSSAPIPTKDVQASVAAKEPGQLAPAPVKCTRLIKKKVSVLEKIIPVVVGEAATSPDESPAEEDIPVIVEEPNPVLIGDQVSEDSDGAVSLESPVQEPLAAAPVESSEDETEIVAQAVAAELESPEEHDVEDPAPEALIPVISSEALEEETLEESAVEENAVAVEDAVENTSPEQSDPEDPAPADPIPVIPVGASEEETPEENTAEEPLNVAPVDDVEGEEEPLSVEEESLVLISAELEIEEVGEGGLAAEEISPEESVPEDLAIIVPLEPVEPVPDQLEPELEEQEATVPIVSSEPKEDETLTIISAELETEEVGDGEPVAEEIAPEESAPEDPAIIVPLEPVEPVPDQVEQEATDPIIPSEPKEDESLILIAAEVETEEVGDGEPAAEEIAPEESALEDSAIIVPLEPLEPVPDQVAPEATDPIIPSEPKEDESLVLVSAELETEEVGEGGPVAEESAQEEVQLAPKPVKCRRPKKKKVQEELIPVVAGEAATSPNESTAEEDIPVIAEEPNPVFIGDQVLEDTDGAVSLESPVQEPLAETPGQVEPEATVPIIYSEAQEEESLVLVSAELETEEVGEVEPVAEDMAPEELAPEDPTIIVPLEPAEPVPDQVDQEATVPILSSEKEDQAPEEIGPEDPLFIAPDNSNEESLLMTTEDDESLTILSAELEIEDISNVEPKEESIPEEPSVIIPVEPAEQEPAQEEQVEQDETALVITSETKDNEATGEHATEEEYVVVLPIEPETKDEEDLVEPAEEETTPQGSSPEESVVIVPLDPTEEEAELEEHVDEESMSIVTEEEQDNETPEEDEALVLIVPEINNEQDPTTDEDGITCPPEEEDSVAHAAVDTEEGHEEDTIVEETVATTEETAVSVLVEATSEQPSVEVAPDNTTEEVLCFDTIPTEAVWEEGIVPQENDTHYEEILVPCTTQSPSEAETMTALDATEKVSIAATEVHIATVKPVTTSAPAVADAEAEILSSPLQGDDGAGDVILSEDVVEVVLIEEEPEVLLNRGAVLGAALITLMSFISLGFVWTTVVKKLR